MQIQCHEFIFVEMKHAIFFEFTHYHYYPMLNLKAKECGQVSDIIYSHYYSRTILHLAILSLRAEKFHVLTNQVRIICKNNVEKNKDHHLAFFN